MSIRDKNTEKEIARRFDKVQEILDTLQGSGATFLFVGHEGNHFAICGSSTSIESQILLAMMRYPVVGHIILDCAERFDEMNREFGDKARDIVMDHLIEKNTGN